MLKILLIGLVIWSQALYADPIYQVSQPIDNERLSAFLLRQPLHSSSYPFGLAWLVPSSRLAQGQLKRTLLERLDYEKNVPSSSQEKMYTFIKSLPVTGRVLIPSADPRWLQAHPKDDPVLQKEQQVIIPSRPRSVIVFMNDGKKCVLAHQAGLEARYYAKACEPRSFESVDSIWIIQPNGNIQNVGVANWNLERQDELAPGAIVWAPSPSKGWSTEFSAMFAQLLSTQNYDTLASNNAFPADQASIMTLTGSVARDAEITASDWGSIGLLQTPTARMSKAGEIRFHYSNVYPYERYNTFFQPYDFLELGFRYTNIVNQLYGTFELSGNQTFKDKSIDAKVRLLKETDMIPQLAIGLIDLTGTGLFSSEYIVASKRTENFDWSMGLGWGYLGSSGNIANPMAKIFGKEFNTRQNDVGTGGQLATGAYLRGNSALFGGVQYHTPLKKWLIKLEYDGNNYQQEPFSYQSNSKSPINAGVVYRYNSSVDLTLGYERGNTYLFGFTLHAPLNRLNAPKVSDPPPLKVYKTRPSTEPIWEAIVADMAAASGRWSVRQISIEQKTLHVVIESPYGAHFNDRIEQIIAVLHRNSPATIEEFSLVFIERGIPMTQRVIAREPWVKKSLEFQAIDDSFQKAPVIYAKEPHSLPLIEPLWESNPSRFGYSIAPSWQQNLGGPDAFVLFRAGVSTPFKYQVSESTMITGSFSVGLFDNYGKFKYTGPSQLPRVRTYLREYQVTSQVYMPNLQITHLGKLTSDHYYSAYGGYLETMFAGVGGEWLYRPWHSPFAVGVDINQVQQRSFEQDFSFDNASAQTGYRVATGHATAYWDTGWESTHVKLSAGRYLAGDIGATLNIARAFDNGVALGIWGTKTNVSSAKFGEGSFDKGIYLNIPFDVMTTTRSSQSANLVYHPLTRDGGSQLNRNMSLYDATNSRSKRQTSFSPSETAGPK
jgi:hypothetical protein